MAVSNRYTVFITVTRSFKFYATVCTASKAQVKHAKIGSFMISTCLLLRDKLIQKKITVNNSGKNEKYCSKSKHFVKD